MVGICAVCRNDLDSCDDENIFFFQEFKVSNICSAQHKFHAICLGRCIQYKHLFCPLCRELLDLTEWKYTLLEIKMEFDLKVYYLSIDDQNVEAEKLVKIVFEIHLKIVFLFHIFLYKLN